MASGKPAQSPRAYTWTEEELCFLTSMRGMAMHVVQTPNSRRNLSILGALIAGVDQRIATLERNLRILGTLGFERVDTPEKASSSQPGTR